MKNQEKDDIIRAKQAISPNGIENQSAEGNSGPGSEIDPEPLPADEREDTYMNGDDPAENVRVMHPNRGTDKPDIDKPAYE